MIEILIITAALALILATVALVIAIISLTDVKAMKASTHTIQYIDPTKEQLDDSAVEDHMRGLVEDDSYLPQDRKSMGFATDDAIINKKLDDLDEEAYEAMDGGGITRESDNIN